jgi:uncharacterized membrane protein YhaH (DUF805 family)
MFSWYWIVLQRYAKFDGRAHRAEYWSFELINAAIGLLFFLAINILVPGFSEHLKQSSLAIALKDASPLAILTLFVFAAYFLAILIPSLAVRFRRFHDIGRSGWWLLLGFVPFGHIVLLVFVILPGNQGPNEYGPDPKNEVVIA